jgi:hypothetical protein
VVLGAGLRNLLLIAVVLAAFLAARSDAKAALNTTTTLSAFARDSALALDSSGYPVVAYRDSLDTRLKILHCNDPYCAGGGESLSSIDLEPGQWPSITLDGAGNPIISYYTTMFDRLKFLHCNDPNCVAPESIERPDPDTFLVEYQTSLAIDSSGNAVIAYSLSPEYEVRILHCNDLLCDGENESITIHGSGVGAPSLRLDASGNPVVAYYAHGGTPSTGTLRVMHCNDPDCGGGGESVTTPDTSPGITPSLALDSLGRPVIAYYTGSTTQDLKLMRCNDVNCAGQGEYIVTIDSAGDVGVDPELELFDGNPVVTYRDETNDDLKLLRCFDAYCAGGNDPIVPLDTASDSGNNSSLVRDADGNPAITYDADPELRLLRCGSEACIESVGGLAGAPDITRPRDGGGVWLVAIGALAAAAAIGGWRLGFQRSR